MASGTTAGFLLQTTERNRVWNTVAAGVDAARQQHSIFFSSFLSLGERKYNTA